MRIKFTCSNEPTPDPRPFHGCHSLRVWKEQKSVTNSFPVNFNLLIRRPMSFVGNPPHRMVDDFVVKTVVSQHALRTCTTIHFDWRPFVNASSSSSIAVSLAAALRICLCNPTYTGFGSNKTPPHKSVKMCDNPQIIDVLKLLLTSNQIGVSSK